MKRSRWGGVGLLRRSCIFSDGRARATLYVTCLQGRPHMKAVVMAGGEGSRLRPLTIRRPKPMVPIAGKPVMEHILNLLKRHGITEVVVTVQYLASNIEDYFGNGSQLGMRITYSREDVPLGTAGSVKNAEEQLTEPFLVISGDALTDYNLTDLIKYHNEKKSMATLLLAHVHNPLEYGVISRMRMGISLSSLRSRVGARSSAIRSIRVSMSSIQRCFLTSRRINSSISARNSSL